MRKKRQLCCEKVKRENRKYRFHGQKANSREGKQKPCMKRLSEKMSTWTSAQTAADCFRKTKGGDEKSSAQINVEQRGITGIRIRQTGRTRRVHVSARNVGRSS